MFQMESGDWISVLSPFLAIFILVVLMGIMIIAYTKFRIFLVVLVIFLFSLIIGVASMEMGDIPFTPYFQYCFIMIQTVFFLLTSIKTFKFKGD